MGFQLTSSRSCWAISGWAGNVMSQHTFKLFPCPKLSLKSDLQVLSKHKHNMGNILQQKKSETSHSGTLVSIQFVLCFFFFKLQFYVSHSVYWSQSPCLSYTRLLPTLIKSYWQCYCCILSKCQGNSKTFTVLRQQYYVLSSIMSAILSAVVNSKAWQAPLLNFLKSQCSCWRGSLHVYVWQYVQV